MTVTLMKSQADEPFDPFDEFERMRRESIQELLRLQEAKAFVVKKPATENADNRPGALPKRKPKPAVIVPSPPVAYKKPKAPKDPRPDRFASKDNYFTLSDGTRRLITALDQDMLMLIEALGFLTADQIAVLRGSNTKYIMRRMGALESVHLVSRRLNSLHKTVWVLTAEGHKYLDTQFIGKLRSFVPTPFKKDHTRHSNINTLAVKLSAGVDENLLFDKDEIANTKPLPLLSKAWIDASCWAKRDVTASDAGYQETREELEISVAGNTKHPFVKSRYKHLAVHHPTGPSSKGNLQGLYGQLDTAWLFGARDLSTGLFAPELNPDLVVLRPIVETPDGWDFNCDGIIVIETPTSAEEYKQKMIANFATGMLGRLHFFRSPNKKIVDRILIKIWNELVEAGTLGPNLASYGEKGCWLSIRDLPEQVSNTGKGEDDENHFGSRMARTRYDG